ncbi:Predicted exonuclease of the beta-lactamase fold involved in RNA processing [Methylacidimicrobium sp. AP8]|uniref:MBL fold metallo-hydrolase n=1 Tax=Methylacidimicrobium sp. AP8 TaxID=2730359 RepID=UPI0018BFED58|nr:MBL fold metallo-hydrolase [Methylacidimicrobium sp. AP8]CAB4244589.1 Predicted exonuclease of the beta-lactamase fold involved in RNA processing [Methylacidimicrobium sp. AP8]
MPASDSSTLPLVKFTNLTRANEIGANCYLLEFDGEARVILDAGMHPRKEGEEATPNLGLLGERPADALIVSHAHHDHIGALPLFLRRNEKMPVYLSEATSLLAEPLLHNSVEVMLKQRAQFGIASYPLFTHKEVDRSAKSYRICRAGQECSIAEDSDSNGRPLTFRFYPGGHILGAVGVRFRYGDRRILYSGDVSFQEQTIMPAADFPLDGIDTLIIEATRGAKETPDHQRRPMEVERLISAIEATFRRGGAVLIPVFALGKTQELLATIHLEQKAGRLRRCPITIGGLSRSFTQIYDRLAKRSFRRHPGLSLLEDVAPSVLDGRSVRQLSPRPGELYLISSGMMTERTLSNILAQRFLSDERHSIFIVGYCDPNSPAGQLLQTSRGNLVALDSEQPPQPLLCEVEQFDLTSHAIREDLLAYILRVNPRLCVLVHGDAPALAWFQERLREERPGLEVIVPPPGETLEL